MSQGGSGENASQALASQQRSDQQQSGPQQSGQPRSSQLRSSQLFARACEVIPGGVNSPVRAFGSVGGDPYFVSHAQGAHIWDTDGNRYIDYVMSYGPLMLGHAHPAVVDAVSQAAVAGTTYGAPTEREVLLAEKLCSAISGMEMVRLTSSGTEATMSAVRLARGVTGRSCVLKFAGCYHGHADFLLAAGGSGVANQGLSGCDGVPASAVADTIVAPYNEIPAVLSGEGEVLSGEVAELAAIVVEPIAANMGLVAPQPGFLQDLRAACDETGALLIFDEVITGFRLCKGGAEEYFGVTPDIWSFGKVIGGGLPIGAFGASKDIMEHVAPKGGVYQAGTLSGNPLATAAGLATLERLDSQAFETLTATATQLREGIASACAEAGLPVVLPQIGPLLGLFFCEDAPQNFDQVKVAAENGIYAKFFHAMLEQGVALAPGPYEILFPSLAHTEEDIDRTCEAARQAAAVSGTL